VGENSTALYFFFVVAMTVDKLLTAMGITQRFQCG
jgi:hypothetical protein